MLGLEAPAAESWWPFPAAVAPRSAYAPSSQSPPTAPDLRRLSATDLRHVDGLYTCNLCCKDVALVSPVQKTWQEINVDVPMLHMMRN